jgi:hypothetical protein
VARRQNNVLRNLDDPLRVMGLLTFRSCGLLLMFFALAFALDQFLRLWTLVFGQWAMLAEIGMTVAAGVVLRFVERHDDEHYVPSALQYLIERPWRLMYAAGAPEDFRGHRLERVLRAR